MAYLLYSPECKVLVRLLQTVQQVSTLFCLGDLYIKFAEFARQVASVTLFNLTGFFCCGFFVVVSGFFGFLTNYSRSAI